MKFLKTLSIKNKLIGMSMLIGFITLSVIFISVIIKRNISEKEKLLNDYQLKIKLVSEYCIVPLDFNFKKEANDILSKLQNLPDLMDAVILDNNNQLFATYNRNYQHGTFDYLHIETKPSFDNNYLYLSEPIILNNKILGKLHFRVSLESFHYEFKSFSRDILIILLLQLILIFILVNFLQKVITNPIIRLKEFAREIAVNPDYSKRIKSRHEDEIGLLYNSFNLMIQIIEKRDIEKNETQKKLEKQNIELKEANLRVEESEKMFRQVVENIHEFFWLRTKDKMLYISPGFEAIYGRKTDDLDKNPDAYLQYVIDEDKEELAKQLAKVKDNKYYELTFRIERPDEEIRWIWINVSYIQDEEGNWTDRQAGIGMDITGRKMAEQSLILAKENAERNETLFNSFMENAPMYTYIDDENLDQIYRNKKIWDLFSEIEYNPFSTNDLFEKDKRWVIEEAAKKILRGKTKLEILEYSTTFNKLLNEEVWLKDIKFLIQLPNQKKLVGGIAIDVSREKRAEKELIDYKNNLENIVKERTNELESVNKELQITNKELHQQKENLQNTLKNLHKIQAQLIQSEKMASLGVLVAGVAHEINNPVNFINSSLTGLKNNLEYLSDFITIYDKITVENYIEIINQVKDKEKDVSLLEVIEMFKKSIEIIEIGIERTTKIVKGLKSFAHSDTNDLEAFNINDNIDNTLIILKSQYKNRIEIIKKYGKLPNIHCYVGQINQVIMNIMVNAFQSIEDRGKVWISTRPANNNSICIEIKDTGTGIPENLLKHIFDPFYTTKKVGQGTGLGLSISYNIIKAHKGNILVESEVGKGTSFTIMLPVKQQNNR